MTTADDSLPPFDLGDMVVQLRIDGSIDAVVQVVVIEFVDGALAKVFTSGEDQCYRDMQWRADGSPVNSLFRLGQFSIVRPRPEHAEAVAAYEARRTSNQFNSLNGDRIQ